jgi:hypothetical protein
VLRGIERLHREVARLNRPRSAIITPTPGGWPTEVRVGDEVQITYNGELRHVRVLAITSMAIRAWDLDKQSMRSFTFMKIGAAKTPRETDAAAQQ